MSGERGQSIINQSQSWSGSLHITRTHTPARPRPLGFSPSSNHHQIPSTSHPLTLSPVFATSSSSSSLLLFRARPVVEACIHISYHHHHHHGRARKLGHHVARTHIFPRRNWLCACTPSRPTRHSSPSSYIIPSTALLLRPTRRTGLRDLRRNRHTPTYLPSHAVPSDSVSTSSITLIPRRSLRPHDHVSHSVPSISRPRTSDLVVTLATSRSLPASDLSVSGSYRRKLFSRHDLTAG